MSTDGIPCADDPCAENIVALYERYAQRWAELRSTRLFEQPWLDTFLNLIRPGGHILDIGCGNGTPVAAYFIRQKFQVTGVDASPAMIARCRRSFADQQWAVADMRTLALGQQFDGLLAWDSFFHLTRDAQRNMFAHFAAHARTNAPLMFTSGPSDGEAIGQFEGHDLYHASLAPQEYRRLLESHGFSLLKHVVNDPQCGGRTIWLAVKSA
ncbi:class I SAM-dependent DNA methyltransferase [Klebsiella sp. I138]|uniref:class I SAM-dependent DNA methyltransferase n=1 Tax=Klebsiella sp. I138 TaxID=2755385 RepID=UPI003DA7BEA0